MTLRPSAKHLGAFCILWMRSVCVGGSQVLKEDGSLEIQYKQLVCRCLLFFWE